MVDTEHTYTLEDLDKWDFGGTALAVIGSPIEHSLSPVMHAAALQVLSKTHSRFKDWRYFRFDISPEKLPEALKSFHERNFYGLNLTVPHKVDAMHLIEGVSADGERMGAVNTLVWNENGYDGFNTDGDGLACGLQESFGRGFDGAEVIILGSGGAARAAAVKALFDGCVRLRVGNRSAKRLEGLINDLRRYADADKVSGFELPTLPGDLAAEGILINATSVGLKPNDPAPVSVANLGKGWLVYDMIYKPETQLFRDARSAGLRRADGLSMLVHQGAQALEIWSHETVDRESMYRAARAALSAK